MNLLPDIPRIYTAWAEWCACLIYILAMGRRRLNGWALAGTLAGALILHSVFLHFTGLRFTGALARWATNLVWLSCMAIAIGFMFLLLWLCGGGSLMDSGYCCVRAFVLAELAASLEWQLHCFFWPDGETAPPLALGLLAVVYGVVFIAAWLLERGHVFQGGPLGINRKELGSAVVIGLAVFAVSNLGLLSDQTPFSAGYDMGILAIRTVVDLGGLAILYAHHIQCCELRTRRELESMEQVLQNQYLQYQQSKESIDLINRKYHDLKHQIAALRAESDPGRREAFLDQMDREIKVYEAQNKTGSPVLDTILTSKSLYCVQHDITLTSVADGHLLTFLDVMDICTIFGNILDNAIEYVSTLDQPEKRLIHLSLSSQKGFLLLRVENYCEADLSFRDGLPVTTKGDAAYHGFGLKSVRHTVEKYGGSLTVCQEDSWVEVKALIPLPEGNGPAWGSAE